ncbi:putative ABC transporter [Aureococcus anophagefferens]|uniref:Putative ABC transporter n=1 Tax=Aureococcus anophagefferens TaxID=44056 RepID=F0YGK8_AURAN|nr:putative ABC transporter [Aureococcus anophagefferens]EGB05777.1 putative ABC transporter [Aureococcus anophagefferens]|eukprot:XP_009039615.1 putative ABC transporter [Aureococcus anophagefferens]
MEAPDDTTSTADEHKEEERKEGDPPGDIAVEPAAPPSPGGAGRGPEADGGPPKAARGDEVLCVCCNYGTVARCVDCVCGFEQLNYNEENLIYKNVVRLALLVACAFYAYETCGVVEKRFQVYAHAPYWVRYSHIFAEALGDGAKRRQPSAERAGAFDPAGVSNLIDRLYGDSYSKADLALLKQSHCNASVVLESANGKRDTDDCGIDAPVYKRGCRAGYYEPRGAARGPNPHLDTAAPCPDGFFCLADVTCFIACPLGSPDRVGVECLAGHFCPQGSFHRVRCRWYEQCEGPGRVSANKFYAMAAIAGIVFLLAFGTSSVWVSLMAYLHLRRVARRHVAPRDDASFAALRASSDGDREASLASRAAPDDGDDYASRTRRACFAAVGACGFVVRHAKRQAYVLVHAALTACAPSATALDPQSIFRRDAERRHCCGVSPANHLRVALAAGLSLVALVLVTLGRLSSFHALVGAYAGVAALLVASSCALCTFQRAAGARTCLLCSKEGHAAMALLGCAVGLGFGALVVLRRGVLDYDDDGVDDDAAPRHLEVKICLAGLGVGALGALGVIALSSKRFKKVKAEPPVLGGDLETPLLVTRQPGDDDAAALVAERESAAPRASERDSLASSASRPVRFTIDVDFEDLGLKLRSSGLQVLKGVTGRCASGRVTAIMGPSGAGKTTMLNVLSGRASYGVTTGVVAINGVPESVQGFGPFVGFVPQEDTMHTNLTVGENVEFYGALRLPRHYTAWDVRKVVERTLEVLGLEHIEGSVIGDAEKRGISGGQRKRVNVAMEIVSDPSLLFLDEPTTVPNSTAGLGGPDQTSEFSSSVTSKPTSGLDSTTSFELVQSLRVLSGRKVNVVVVLHQPSFFIFRMFHDVLLLCRGGRTAYCGPSEGALPYFEASGFSMPAFENPADFFMDVIAGKAAVRDGASPFSDALADVAGVQDSRKGARQHAAALAELWERHAGESRDTLEDAPHPTTPGRLEPAGRLSRSSRRAHRKLGRASRKRQRQVRKMATKLSQFNIFFRRTCLLLARDRHQFAVDCCIQLACGAFFGLLYENFEFKDAQTLFFMLNLGVGLTASLASLRVFGSDRAVFWREAAPGSGMELDRFAYFLAKNAVEVPRLAVFATLTLATFARCRRRGFIFLRATYSCAVRGVGLRLSMVMLVLVFVLFCGISPKLSQIDNMGPAAQRAPARAVSRSRGLAPGPRRYASALSYGRWYVEGLYTSQTRQLSDAWKMRVFPAPRPWAWYAKPNQDCALAGLFSLSFSELYRAKSGHLRTINDLNIPILFAIGAAMRVVSYLLLLLCNRDKMGKQTILQLLAQFFLNPVSDLLDDVVGAWERGFGRKRRGERV